VQCVRGNKCKYSHDMEQARKGPKISLYEDQRDVKAADTIDQWDTEKLAKVVGSKIKGKLPPTEIICKFFLDAIENSQYGWFWSVRSDRRESAGRTSWRCSWCWSACRWRPVCVAAAGATVLRCRFQELGAQGWQCLIRIRSARRSDSCSIGAAGLAELWRAVAVAAPLAIAVPVRSLSPTPPMRLR